MMSVQPERSEMNGSDSTSARGGAYGQGEWAMEPEDAEEADRSKADDQNRVRMTDGALAIRCTFWNEWEA
jgi:hypothetical protein